ncbi:MAG: type II secretion system secretin GspD [Burkholderiaceae bacterium]|nr:type II secretion system secretin GspD [Burkholderiaceae bacterium]
MSGPRWQRFGVAAALLCAFGGVQPAWAQVSAGSAKAADADGKNDEATLNFVGADIESVIKAIGHYTNTTFIIDPRVKGTINLVSERPVTKAHAYQLLISALRLQGYTVVIANGFSKVVPEADAKLQVGPAEVSAVKGDQIATQIYQLNYESANNMLAVLRPLISPNNTINANPGNNTLVITDYADNLVRMGKIIAALDTPTTSDMDIVPVKYAIATDLATMINRLLEPTTGTPDAGRVTLTADPRTNSLIVKAPSAARANLAKALIAKLDQQTALPGNVHVVYLKNADAMKLALTLRAVVASDSSATGAGGQAAQTSQTQQTGQQNAPGASATSGQSGMSSLPPSTPSAPSTLPSGGPAGFIQADQATNTLIITASDTLYRNLRTVIDQLDARRAEVYIESLIVEVNDTKAAEFGVQWMALSGNKQSNYRVGGGTSFSSGGNNLLNLAVGNSGSAASSTTTATGPVLPGNGLTVGLFRQVAGQLTLGAVAHAISSDNAANILSMPNLITLDNEEATIIVGQNVPFITGQFTTAASGGSTGVNPFQTVDRKDIGLKLRVRPQISEGGTIKMSIYQESSSIDTTQSNSAGLITNMRAVTTNVLCDDGQIIVLGGLIQDSVSDTDEQVPGLGSLPLIGNLFKYKTRSHTKTNLMVFLRPIVIRNEEQSANVTNDRYDYMRNEQKGTQPQPAFLLPNASAPVLPTDQKGVVGGNGLVKIVPGANGMDGQQQTKPQAIPPSATPQAQEPVIDLTKPKQ